MIPPEDVWTIRAVGTKISTGQPNSVIEIGMLPIPPGISSLAFVD